MNKDILKLALPNILSNISIPLLSTVDVALMGHLSVLHLGAIGLGAMIFNFLFWNFGFLRMGTTGLVAQAYGAKKEVALKMLLSKAVYLAIGIATVLLFLQIPLGYIAMKALAVSSEHAELVWKYFNIRIWSAPATLLTYTLFGWFFGVQNAVIPMIATLLINAINIAISYILVTYYNMGIEGVAIGTVIAEYTGIAFLVIVIHVRFKVRIARITELSDWRLFLSINKDLFIRTIALTGAFLFLYRQSAISGGLVLATNVVLLQFLSWMSYGIDGFAYASESLVGKYFGAKNKEDLIRVVQLSFRWGFILAISFSLCFGLFGMKMANLFTNDLKVLEVIESYIVWLWFLPLLAFICYIWDGIFIGLTETKMMRNSMIISLLFYILVFTLVGDKIFNAIWMTFALFLFMRGLLLSIYWYKIKMAIVY